MIKIILWDIDRTLLDFDANERDSLKTQFKKYGLGECSDEMVDKYSEINVKHWQMLERGELTKDEVMVKRFEEFFRTLSITGVDCSAFTADYEIGLADTVVYIENSPEIIEKLKGKYLQYAVTNGAYNVQSVRLEKAGFYKLFDDVFISDEVGYEKPSREYFDYVLSHIPEAEKSEIIIVGDSLTSDMLGGYNAGILTCRYNPKGAANTLSIPIDYEIKSLNEIFDIVK